MRRLILCTVLATTAACKPQSSAPQIIDPSTCSLLSTIAPLDWGRCDVTCTATIAPAAGAPSAQWGAAAAFDTQRMRGVLFGGMWRTSNGENHLSGETWEWDGGEWTRFDVEGPLPRTGAAMAYDPDLARMVLFGGQSDFTSGCPTVVCGDTWSWDGSAWTLISRTGPHPRYNHAMAYDEERRRTVVFGGNDLDGPVPGLVWELDGAKWSNVDPLGDQR